MAKYTLKRHRLLLVTALVFISFQIAGCAFFNKIIPPIDTQLSTPVDSPEPYFQSGMKAYYEKNYQDAITDLEKAYRLGNKDPDMFRALAICYVNIDDIRKDFYWEQLVNTYTLIQNPNTDPQMFLTFLEAECFLLNHETKGPEEKIVHYIDNEHTDTAKNANVWELVRDTFCASDFDSTTGSLTKAASGLNDSLTSFLLTATLENKQKALRIIANAGLIVKAVGNGKVELIVPDCKDLIAFENSFNGLSSLQSEDAYNNSIGKTILWKGKVAGVGISNYGLPTVSVNHKSSTFSLNVVVEVSNATPEEINSLNLDDEIIYMGIIRNNPSEQSPYWLIKGYYIFPSK